MVNYNYTKNKLKKSRLNICLLSNGNPDDIEHWVAILRKNRQKLTFSIIDLTRSDWFDSLQNTNANLYVVRPPGIDERLKALYDEKIYIIHKILNKPIYPSFDEVMVYENKRFLNYFLKSKNIPHPATIIIQSKRESESYILKIDYPIVAKNNIGASGSGVKILKTKSAAKQYINNVFLGKGASKRWGPNLKRDKLIHRGFHYIIKPVDILKKLKLYQARKSARQQDFVIFQKYVPHSYEWRCVRIGDSFFAHKKIAKKGKSSGTLLKEYDNPPLTLLNYIKNLTDKIGFYSVAVDLFETESSKYLVNEMQCYFGQSDTYQMKVNNKIGRYKYNGKEWIFEEGDFAKNLCYDLRLEHIFDIVTI